MQVQSPKFTTWAKIEKYKNLFEVFARAPRGFMSRFKKKQHEKEINQALDELLPPEGKAPQTLALDTQSELLKIREEKLDIQINRLDR